MANSVSVDFVTKVVEVQVNDNEAESLAALAAINAAQRADEAKALVVDNIDNTLAAIDAKGDEEKDELDDYNETLKNSLSSTIASTMQPYVDAAAASAEAAAETAEGVSSLTTVGVDDTLSISGAAADAKVAGEKISDLTADIVDENSLDIFKHMKHTTVTHNYVTYSYNADGSCYVSGTASALSFSRLWMNSDGWPSWIKKGKTYLIVFSGNKVGFDIFPYRSGTIGTSLVHTNTNTIVTIPNDIDGLLVRYTVQSGVTVNETVKAIGLNLDANDVLYNSALINYGSTVSSSVGLSTDADSITKPSVVFVSVNGSGVPSISNTPYDAAGWLVTYKSGYYANGSYFHQIFYPYATTRNIVRRIKQNDGWTNWIAFGGGGGGTIEQTINVTQVQNTNTYSATISPDITTDDNGWLQPVDTDTESETSKTDMTSAIMAMLNSTGYCHLAPGIFYVSGNIDMPEGSTLEGCGQDTIIRLLASEATGYCVRMGRYNTVKNIRFSGGYNDGDVSDDDIGGRNGIIYIANADGEESAQPTVTPCVLTGCWFENFSGSAIYAHNSGGSMNNAMMVSSCYIQLCEVGINLDYNTEYHKFTNVIVRKCYYACINNGGNNVFTGCTFHGTIGFMIDNASNTKTNNAHGSCVGCTFNHIDNWNHPGVLGMGEAVKIIGPSTSGFIFTGCQFWYGSINVNNAKGIGFSDCLIGGNTPEINVTNNATAFFVGCIFRQVPLLNILPSTKLDSCYLAGDGRAISG